jgi:glutamine cyclotransferase
VKHRRHAWRALLLLLLLSGSGTLSAADTPPVPVYGYEVLERRAQPRENFVQGLEFFADRLYVGTGLRGQSRLREYRFDDMSLLREQRLPEAYFGEGITRLGERLYQLTWRAGKVLVYDAERWLPLREGALATEGWGITNDGQRLIYSDGSDRLRFLDPDTLAVGKTLAVTLRGRPLPRSTSSNGSTARSGPTSGQQPAGAHRSGQRGGARASSISAACWTAEDRRRIRTY